MNFEELAEKAANAIIASRELCGNERDAAQQVYDDHETMMTREDYAIAQAKASLKWDRFRREAGVAANPNFQAGGTL